MRTVFSALVLLPFLTSVQLIHKDSFRIRVSNDTVLVKVSVLDRMNRCIVGLEKDMFRIFENGIEQNMIYFSNDPSPVSIGIILDISGSMFDDIAGAREAVKSLVGNFIPGDEYFLIVFNERSFLASDYTSKADNILNSTAFTSTKGKTALYDAVYLGLEKIKEANNMRKGLIIITDGEDNSSRYTFSEVKDFAKETDAQIYMIGEPGELGYGRWIIHELADLTGGRAFFPGSLKQLGYYMNIIHTELRHQYVLGYIPSDTDVRHIKRKIRILLDKPENIPRPALRYRKTYMYSSPLQ